jgi:tRNA A-37 threonylcarbamoyl transferase component Bud32
MPDPTAEEPLEHFRDERGARWVAVASFAEELRARVLPELEALLADPPGRPWAELVKKSHYRRVLRLELASGVVFLKAHAIGHPGRRFGQRCFGTRGENEWAKTRLLRSLGVSTPRPLAAGARQRGFGLARSYYISAEVPSPRTLTAALQAGAERSERAAWLRGLGEDLAVLHRHRLHHRDLHGNNVLLSPASERPVLLDLHSLWRVPLLPPWSRLRSIAKLLASLDDELEMGEDEVFLRAYLGAEAKGDELEALLSRARRRARAVRDEHWGSRVHRALTGGSKIARTKSSLGRSWRVAELAAETPERWFEEALAARGAAVLKDEAARGKVVRLASDAGPLIAKLELSTGLDARGRVWFGRSRARRAWLAAHGLKLRKVACPAPLALLERSNGETLFAMREVEGTTSFESFAAQQAVLLAPEERRALVGALASFVARMHERGGHHDDLSAKNLLLRCVGSSFELFLVDLEDFRLGAAPSDEQLVRALGQLNDVPPRAFSLRERLRFWCAYRRARRLHLDRSAERALLARIDAVTRARVERREGRWRAEGRSGFEAGYFPARTRGASP